MLINGAVMFCVTQTTTTLRLTDWMTVSLLWRQIVFNYPRMHYKAQLSAQAQF